MSVSWPIWCALTRVRASGSPRFLPSLFGRGADDAVVAEAADLRRGCRLEALLEDAVCDLGDGGAHPVELLVGVLHGDPLPGQDVEVALRRGLETPGLAGTHLVHRQLNVFAQLVLGLGAAGLVVDQLV